MSKLARRLRALEQTQAGPPPQIASPQEPHSQEEIARWWAGQYNWPRAAQAMGITESEAIAHWGAESVWHELQAKIAELNEQAQALCRVEEKKPGESASQRVGEEQPPDYLKQAEPKYQYDRRRWTGVQAVKWDPRRRRQ